MRRAAKADESDEAEEGEAEAEAEAAGGDNDDADDEVAPFDLPGKRRPVACLPAGCCARLVGSVHVSACFTRAPADDACVVALCVLLCAERKPVKETKAARGGSDSDGDEDMVAAASASAAGVCCVELAERFCCRACVSRGCVCTCVGVRCKYVALIHACCSLPCTDDADADEGEGEEQEEETDERELAVCDRCGDETLVSSCEGARHFQLFGLQCCRLAIPDSVPFCFLISARVPAVLRACACRRAVGVRLLRSLPGQDGRERRRRCFRLRCVAA